MELSPFLKNVLREQSFAKLEKRALSLAKAFDHGFDRTDEQTEAALDSWQMYRALEIQLRAELKLLEDEDQVLFPPGYFLDFPEDYAA